MSILTTPTKDLNENCFDKATKAKDKWNTDMRPCRSSNTNVSTQHTSSSSSSQTETLDNDSVNVFTMKLSSSEDHIRNVDNTKPCINKSLERESFKKKMRNLLFQFEALKLDENTKTKAYRTLLQILSNINKFPEILRYRFINTNNVHLTSKLTHLPLGQQLMESSGGCLNSNGQKWYFSKNNDIYTKWALETLEQHLSNLINESLKKDIRIEQLCQTETTPTTIHPSEPILKKSQRKEKQEDWERLLHLIAQDKRERIAEAKCSIPPSLHSGNASILTRSYNNNTSETFHENNTNNNNNQWRRRIYIKAPPMRIKDKHDVKPQIIHINRNNSNEFETKKNGGALEIRTLNDLKRLPTHHHSKNDFSVASSPNKLETQPKNNNPLLHNCIEMNEKLSNKKQEQQEEITENNNYVSPSKHLTSMDCKIYHETFEKDDPKKVSHILQNNVLHKKIPFPEKEKIVVIKPTNNNNNPSIITSRTPNKLVSNDSLLPKHSHNTKTLFRPTLLAAVSPPTNKIIQQESYLLPNLNHSKDNALKENITTQGVVVSSTHKILCPQHNNKSNLIKNKIPPLTRFSEASSTVLNTTTPLLSSRSLIHYNNNNNQIPQRTTLGNTTTTTAAPQQSIMTSRTFNNNHITTYNTMKSNITNNHLNNSLNIYHSNRVIPSSSLLAFQSSSSSGIKYDKDQPNTGIITCSRKKILSPFDISSKQTYMKHRPIEEEKKNGTSFLPVVSNSLSAATAITTTESIKINHDTFKNCYQNDINDHYTINPLYTPRACVVVQQQTNLLRPTTKLIYPPEKQRIILHPSPLICTKPPSWCVL